MSELTKEQKKIIKRRNIESMLYQKDEEKEGFSDWLAIFCRYAKEHIDGGRKKHFYSPFMIDYWFSIFNVGDAFNSRTCRLEYWEAVGFYFEDDNK